MVEYQRKISRGHVFTGPLTPAGDTIQSRRESRQSTVCLGGIARKTRLSRPLYFSIFSHKAECGQSNL